MKATAMNILPTEMLAVTLSAQSIGLSLLLAEMRALSEMMPGAVAHMPAGAARVAAAEDTDFDNMPV